MGAGKTKGFYNELDELIGSRWEGEPGAQVSEADESETNTHTKGRGRRKEKQGKYGSHREENNVLFLWIIASLALTPLPLSILSIARLTPAAVCFSISLIELQGNPY